MENSIKKPVIPRVSFSSRNLKDKKEVSIQFRIVLGSDRSSVSATGLKVLKKNWNGKNQYITPRNSIENKVLDSIKYQVREFYYDFCTKSKDYPNAESIKKAYIKGLNTSPLTLNEAISQFKEDKKKEVLESTFRSISVRFKHLEKFSNLKNNPYLSNVNHDFARKFELYLIDLELNRNTIRRIISTLKGLTNYFYMNEFLNSDPLINYKKPKGELIDFVYLNENELHKIESSNYPEHLKNSALIFLFSCYTGLAYIDLKKFDKSKHIKYTNGAAILRLKRQKTINTNETPCFIPLSNKAIEILNKIDGEKLPIYSNIVMNRQLKLIAEYSNINKKITVHSARKTFATSMINMNVSKESLQVMLGHKSSRTTEMYYKIHDHKVINEVLNIYNQNNL